MGQAGTHEKRTMKKIWQKRQGQKTLQRKMSQRDR